MITSIILQIDIFLNVEQAKIQQHGKGQKLRTGAQG